MSTAEPLVKPEIRRMREADLDAVLAVERASFSTPWSRSSFLNLLRRTDTDLWVAEVDGGVAGHAVLWYVGFEGELGNLAIAPEWRRQGLGRYLLDWALEGARKRDVGSVFLEVRVSNRAAQNLYTHYGFRPVGLRKRYYREPVEDARVLSIDLRPPP